MKRWKMFVLLNAASLVGALLELHIAGKDALTDMGSFHHRHGHSAQLPALQATRRRKSH